MARRLLDDHPSIRIETKFGNAEAYGRLSIWALMAAMICAFLAFLAWILGTTFWLST